MAQPPILLNVALERLNTLGLPARAARFVSIESVADLQSLYASSAWADGPALVLGGGSNLVLSKDIDGLVLQIAIPGYQLHSRTPHAVEICCGAGMEWDALVRRCLQDGHGGLENLIAIPGRVGAAPVQNIGAYGVELAERLAAVQVFDCANGALRRLERAACRFGYRDSVFKQQPGRYIIVGVVLRLPLPWQPVLSYGDLDQLAPEQRTAQEIARRIEALRRAKLPDPRVIGNVGSFFKNPVVSERQFLELKTLHPQLVGYPQGTGGVKLAAAWLIEACGWKGRGLGQAAMHDQQALVLVNRGGASAKDVLGLAAAVSQSVAARFGITLEREPVVV